VDVNHGRKAHRKRGLRVEKKDLGKGSGRGQHHESRRTGKGKRRQERERGQGSICFPLEGTEGKRGGLEESNSGRERDERN